MLEECSCGTGTMGWAGTAPWLNHPSNPGSLASGEHFWGGEVSTAGERCPEPHAECPRRQERHFLGNPSSLPLQRALHGQLVPCVRALALCIQLLSLDCSWRFHAACREA